MDFFKHKYSFLFFSSLLFFSSNFAKPVLAQERSDITNLELSDTQQKELIHMTIMDGTPDDVKKLVENQFDVNGNELMCNTPLISAIKSAAGGQWAAQHPEYAAEKVKILVNAGADVNKVACPDMYMPPLSIAVSLPQDILLVVEEVTKALDEKIKKGTEYCDIPGVISKPCREITEEERNHIKEQALSTFKTIGKFSTPYFIEIVQTLVKNGADINKTDINGATPLHHAVMVPENRTDKIVKYLIEKGGNLNIQDKNGNTPLFYAYAFNNLEFVQLLISAGSDTNIRNKENALYNQVSGTEWGVHIDQQGNITKKINQYDE